MNDVSKIIIIEYFSLLLLMVFIFIQSWPFHFPVSSKKLPDYRMIITKPMDLQTMRKVLSL